MKSFNGWDCSWSISNLTGYGLVAESTFAIRILSCLCMFLLGAANASAEFIEPGMLSEKVAAGQLPPIAERIPKNPLRVDFFGKGKVPGKYGGALRMLIGGQRNISSMTVSGYARLVGYDEKLVLRPDILESFEVEAERKFTFHIRPGHRWSDGHLLTAEDFRYALEDVLLNRELNHGVVSAYLLVEERPPTFEVLDNLTIRYSWDAPNPFFLPQIAAAQPLTMVLPAHYLKKFHKAYQSEGELKNMMKENGARTWTALHLDKSRQYRPENPDLPTLDPWRNTTKPPADYFIFERNPFFHRIDPNGRQLPYIDRIALYVSSSSLIAAKAASGEVDLQANNISFSDYTFLKKAEKAGVIRVKLWQRSQGSRMALYPNLNYEDSVWRRVLQDVRFRRALSLAMNRREINLAVFFGLCRPSANTVLPQSSLYREEYASAYAAYDPQAANALLDSMGLERRGRDGFRLLADGRRAEIIVETAGEDPIEAVSLELITDYWRAIGIKLLIRASQTDILRSRIIAGKTMMAMDSGLDNGIPTPDMDPKALAPTSHEQLQWPLWGVYFESRAQMGSKPEMKEAAELLQLYERWRSAATTNARSEVWHRMLSLYTDQVFSIGLVNSAFQPIVVSRNLRNVPDKAIYGFDPTAYFGVYGMDTFWFDTQGQ